MTEFIRTFKMRLLPTAPQSERLNNWFYHYRLVYNAALEHRKARWDNWKIPTSKYDQKKELPAIKAELEWLKDSPSCILQDAILDFDTSLRAFFRRIKEAKLARQMGKKPEKVTYPKFKNEYMNQCIRFNHSLCSFRQETKKLGFIKIPKIGELRVCWNRKVPGRLKSIAVTRDRSGKFWTCITVAIEHTPSVNRGGTIGIARGVRQTVTTSVGQIFNLPYDDLAYWFEKSRIARRSMSRKKKYGANWKKARDRLRKIDRKIANIRRNWIHHATKQLATEHGKIFIRDLGIKELSKSGKGTVDQPGELVELKAKFNRFLLNTGGFIFYETLRYKAPWYGSELGVVGPEYTEQTCSRCGHIRGEHSFKALFRCDACNFEENAGINKAVNVLKEGRDLEAVPV